MNVAFTVMQREKEKNDQGGRPRKGGLESPFHTERSISRWGGKGTTLSGNAGKI